MATAYPLPLEVWVMFGRNRIIGSILLTIIVIGFLFLAPSFLSRGISEEETTQQKDYSGIIHIWHVVGFKPYSGSLGNTLSSVGKEIEKTHRGVFFEVKAMDEDEYEMRLARGEHADILSFPLSLASSASLLTLSSSEELMLPDAWRGIGTAQDGTLHALPYTASSHILLVNTGLLQEMSETLPEGAVSTEMLQQLCDRIASALKEKNRKGIGAVAGTQIALQACGIAGETVEYDVFRKGKAVFAAADLRAVAEMRSLEKNGKGFVFAAYPLIAEQQELIQLVSLDARMDDAKMPFAMEYISLLFTEKVQKTLLDQGLISPYTALHSDDEPRDPLLMEVQKAFDPASIPNMYGADRKRRAE